MTYAELYNLVRGKSGRNRRKIANNTWAEIEPESGRIMVKFHDTNIIRAFPNGYWFLTNGGFKTVTTKQRLNRFTPFQVWQKNHVWYTRKNGEDIEFDAGVAYME